MDLELFHIVVLKYKQINYIRNQKNHHLSQSFKDEYIAILNEFEIDFKIQYLFEWIDYNKLE